MRHLTRASLFDSRSSHPDVLGAHSPLISIKITRTNVSEIDAAQREQMLEDAFLTMLREQHALDSRA
jgi:hypothetical protein